MRKFVLREDPAYLHYYDPAGVRDIWPTLVYTPVSFKAAFLQKYLNGVFAWECVMRKTKQDSGAVCDCAAWPPSGKAEGRMVSGVAKSDLGTGSTELCSHL